MGGGQANQHKHTHTHTNTNTWPGLGARQSENRGQLNEKYGSYSLSLSPDAVTLVRVEGSLQTAAHQYSYCEEGRGERVVGGGQLGDRRTKKRCQILFTNITAISTNCYRICFLHFPLYTFTKQR